MIELASVHVPKAGGTSIQRLLRRKYGNGLRLIYQAPPGPPLARLRRNLGATIRSWRSSPLAVHGHFPASRFAGRAAMLVCFVRDPLLIRISAWHFIRREYARHGFVFNRDWKNAIRLDLPDFIAHPHPVLSAFLDVPLDWFTLIGDVASFEADMTRLCTLLDAPHGPFHFNANPDGSNYEVPVEWRRQYEKANPKEVALYEKIRQLSGRR